VPHAQLKVTVREAWVTLTGEVEWQYQRVAAERAVRRLVGVRGVSDQIVVKPRVTAADVKTRIEAALRRNAELEARRLQVDVTDRKVVLRGKVHSWNERQEAERAAWAAPGVAAVEDDLTIGV
jgi:osmotically-inducible protein OsmY